MATGIALFKLLLLQKCREFPKIIWNSMGTWTNERERETESSNAKTVEMIDGSIASKSRTEEYPVMDR